MTTIYINDKEIQIKDQLTVFEACKLTGITIPHFCYHPKLKVAGNCRMCLVEIAKMPKPVASCAMPVSEGMHIYTNTKKVKDAREGVMELLLVNHPLDCPICDQGGECDLQDQAFKYGKGISRYNETKRSVQDKYMGPLIQTFMNRCIHCTRCIRFANDIAGIEEVGAIYRGENMEITSLEKTVQSELSGNMIDLCPVGALTSKPYAYRSRNWETDKFVSIDIHDAVGSNIVVHTIKNKVVRILPKHNDDINDEWCTDKVRFAFDGLSYQRLDQAYIRSSKQQVLSPTTIDQAIEQVADILSRIKPSEVAVIAGQLVDVETLFSMKKLMDNLKVRNLNIVADANKYDTTARGNYLFNTKISDISNADFCLLIGANPKITAPIVNAKIGQRVRENFMQVYSIGCYHDQTYLVKNISNSVKVLLDILNYKESDKLDDHKQYDQIHQSQISELCTKLMESKKPMIIIGDGVMQRSDSKEIQKICKGIAHKFGVVTKEWNGFNILHSHASTVAALDLGFYNQSQSSTCNILDNVVNGNIKVLYLIGADDIDHSKLENCFVIYQGHHGDKSAEFADIVIPTPVFSEKSSIYVNLEGKAQKTEAATEPLGSAQEDFQVIHKLSQLLKHESFDDIEHLRAEIYQEYPFYKSNIYKDNNWNKYKINSSNYNNFMFTNKIYQSNVDDYKFEDYLSHYNDVQISDEVISDFSFDFYMTDPICRASPTMLKCKQEKDHEA